MEELRTTRQIKTDNLHQEVIGEVLALQSEHPELKPYRVFTVAARKLDMSVTGVRSIMERHGLYQPSRKGGEA